jgi:predicted nucleic acid-binding protein
MARYAIDAPTLLRIVTRNVDVKGHQLVAPHAIRSRALTTLLQQVTTGAITEKQARELHTKLTVLQLRVLGDRTSRWLSFELAHAHGWPTTYEAEYVAIAKLQADALVTIDPALAKKARGIVPLAPFKALTE